MNVIDQALLDFFLRFGKEVNNSEEYQTWCANWLRRIKWAHRANHVTSILITYGYAKYELSSGVVSMTKQGLTRIKELSDDQ